MINYLVSYQKDLKKVITKAEIQKAVSDLILVNNGESITAKVIERWEKGDGVEGGVIGAYKWKEYELLKASMNPLAGGAVDLIFTGALSNNLMIKKKSKGIFQIYSIDEKYEKIGDKYGFEQYGLTKEQEAELFESIFNEILDKKITELWG